jgi:adenine-specific DNA methylase
MYTEDALVPSMALPIKRIEKLPLPYTGNKKKLLFQLYETLLEHDVQFDSVLDAFSGSAAVTLLFKMMGKRVLANDLLTSSYINSVAFVENPGIKLTEEEKRFLLHNENAHKGTFVEDNYLGKQYRPPGKNCRFNKFTLKECRHLDNFRANVDELAGLYGQSLSLAANTAVILRLPFGNVDQSHDLMTHRRRQEAEYGDQDRRIGIYYDKNMDLNFEKWFAKYVNDFVQGMKSNKATAEYNSKIKRAAFLANLQQHVLRDCMVQGRFHRGQALAETDVRLAHQKNQLKKHWTNEGSTEMDFFTRAGTGGTEGKPGQGMKWWTFADLKVPGSCIAVNMDVIDLLQSDFCRVDCVYFDPPYGGSSSNYAEIYRFLEEYIYSQPLESLPHIQANAKRFVGRKHYEEHFREMLEAAHHIPMWLFSYNDNSWKDIEYISEIIREYKKNVEIVVLDDEYRYLYRSKQGRTNKSCEYLIIARNV